MLSKHYARVTSLFFKVTKLDFYKLHDIEFIFKITQKIAYCSIKFNKSSKKYQIIIISVNQNDNKIYFSK